MIDKHFGDYTLVCDICNEEAEEYWDTFQDAVDGRQELGWKRQIRAGEWDWQDICPECQGEE